MSNLHHSKFFYNNQTNLAASPNKLASLYLNPTDTYFSRLSPPAYLQDVPAPSYYDNLSLQHGSDIHSSKLPVSSTQVNLENSTTSTPPSSGSSICSSSSECSGRSTATFQPSPSSPLNNQFNGLYNNHSANMKSSNSMMVASLGQMKGSFPGEVINRLDGYSREEDAGPNHKEIVKRNNMFITPSLMSIEGK